MREITMGIIGGCLSHQRGIPRSALYHQQLAKSLADSGKARLRFRIARDFDREYLYRFERLREECDLDCVLVHVRSEVVRKAALLVTLSTADEIRVSLHPYLFSRGETGWAEKVQAGLAGHAPIVRFRRKTNPATSSIPSHRSSSRVNHSENLPGRMRRAHGQTIVQGDYRAPYSRQYGLLTRSIILGANVIRYLGGLFAGLDQWAIDDELRMVQELHQRCQKLGLPLFVLGPARYPRPADRISRSVSKGLLASLHDWNIPYQALDQIIARDGGRYCVGDGVHLNVLGHHYVSERIELMLLQQFFAKEMVKTRTDALQ